MVVMSFLLPEKPHSVSLGISARLRHATGNKARGEKRERLYTTIWDPLKIFFDISKVCLEAGRRTVLEGRTDGGGAKSVSYIKLKTTADSL